MVEPAPLYPSAVSASVSVPQQPQASFYRSRFEEAHQCRGVLKSSSSFSLQAVQLATISDQVQGARSDEEFRAFIMQNRDSTVRHQRFTSSPAQASHSYRATLPKTVLSRLPEQTLLLSAGNCGVWQHLVCSLPRDVPSLCQTG